MTAGAGRGRSGFGPAERYGLRLVLLAGAVAVAAIPFATLTFNVIADGPLIRWDGTLADSLNEQVHARRGVLVALEAVSWLGRPPVLALVVVAAAVWCGRQGRHRAAVFLLTTTAGGAVLGTVVKLVVDRPRPVVDHPVSTAFGKSFPSGHAMHATIAYGAIVLVALPLLSPRVRRRVVLLAATAVVAIGSSRLLLGLHFLTDVAGGYLLGAAWLTLSAAAFETWRDEVRDEVRDGERTPERDAVRTDERDDLRSGAGRRPLRSMTTPRR